MDILNSTWTAKNISATATIKSGNGRIGGWLVNASSSGTLTVYDGTSTGGRKLTNATPLTAGQFIPFPVSVQDGIHVVIGGTADITILYS